MTMAVDEDMITAAIETKGDTYHLEVLYATYTFW